MGYAKSGSSRWQYLLLKDFEFAVQLVSAWEMEIARCSPQSGAHVTIGGQEQRFVLGYSALCRLSEGR